MVGPPAGAVFGDAAGGPASRQLVAPAQVMKSWTGAAL